MHKQSDILVQRGSAGAVHVQKQTTGAIVLIRADNNATSVHHSNGFEFRRYVTFYFTNVPDMVPYFCVREGFEVCGILDNLFLLRKRNKQGHI